VSDPREKCLANTVSFVVRGADSIASAGGIGCRRRLRFERFGVFGGFTVSRLMWLPPQAGRIWQTPSSVFLWAAIPRRSRLISLAACCRKLSAGHNSENNHLNFCEWLVICVENFGF
jgi:hypothetical protein